MRIIDVRRLGLRAFQARFGAIVFAALASIATWKITPSSLADSESGEIDQITLTYASVPRAYSTTPEVFRALLLDQHTSPTRIAFFGDSTSFDNLGAGGEHMNWRRWVWHQHFGHTPGTQLSRPANFGGRVPGAEWMFMGGVGGEEPSIVPDSYLPPGHHAAANAAKTFKSGTIGQYLGLNLILNHRNDNNFTMGCGSIPSGFYYVQPAISQGTPWFAAGSMQGGASLIDALAGIRVEVLATNHPQSAPTVAWISIPATAGDYCAPGSVPTIFQGGSLFGGTQSLTGPLGAAFRSQTPVLSTLSEPYRFYRVIVTGSSTDPAQAVQIIGARFLSGNHIGLITDSFSAGGYMARSLPTNHPNCGPVLAASGYGLAWMMYGLNDQFQGHSAAVFEQDVRNTVTFIRIALNDPSFPIVLETCTYPDDESVQGRYYAGALMHIAEDTANVMLINSRRVTEDRYGWGIGTEESCTFDGVHYTNLGAEAVSRSSIETVIAYLTATPAPVDFVRQPKASRGKDTSMSSGAPTTECGTCPTLAVGVGSGAANRRRVLLTFDDLNRMPPNSVVQSAQLRLTVDEVSNSSHQIEFNRVITPNWTEGNNDGTGATWNSASSNPAQLWTTPGGDYTTVGQVANLAIPDWLHAASGDLVTYDVTSLAQDAFLNRGGVLAMIIKRSDEFGSLGYATFCSSDHPIPSQRPMLVIKFLPPPLPPWNPCLGDCAPPPGGNGIVNVDDLLMVVLNWGPGGGGGPGDISPPDGNGVVNIDDLLVVINGWGTCPITQ